MKMKLKFQRAIAGLLTACMAVGLIPGAAIAARAAEPSPKAAVTSVAPPDADATASTFEELRAAITAANAADARHAADDTPCTAERPYVIDIQASFLITSQVDINGHVQLIVSDPNAEYTLGRGWDNLNYGDSSKAYYLPYLFNVKPGASLTLGHGQLNSDNTVTPSASGALILDGGARWRGWTTPAATDNPGPEGTVGDEWTWDQLPLVYDDPKNPTHTRNVYILMDAQGTQRLYANDGAYGNIRMICNTSGTLNIYDSVTLQNNQTSTGLDQGGSAIYCVGTETEKVTLNMFGGTVRNCAMIGGGQSHAWGAVYVGEKNHGSGYFDENDSHAKQPAGVFNMYGSAAITHNGVNGGLPSSSSSSKVADGGGVGLDQVEMNMYGGEISYNRVGFCHEGTGNTSNGGGIQARASTRITLYGGSIHHNFANSKGGGINLWNSQLIVKEGATISNNIARDGGGVSIAGASSDNVHNLVSCSRLIMQGGEISSNEARDVPASSYRTGYGGGIAAGTPDRPDGAVLYLQGGTISQNKAEFGGGLSIYAGQVTAIHMSGDAVITGNSAYQAGDGLILDNDDFISTITAEMIQSWKDYSKANSPDQKENDPKYWPDNIKPGTAVYDFHALLTMEGNARIDTNNSIYFKDIARRSGTEYQIPVKVTKSLTSDGVVGLLEFDQSFWNGTAPAGVMAAAAEGLDLITFTGCAVQENKFAIESASWYLKDDSATKGDDGVNHLELARYGGDTPLYSYRNGTGIDIGGKTYYRLYEQLSDAVNEAADHDTIYVVYNSTIASPVVIDHTSIKLVAENTSSAGIDAGSSGGAFGLKRYDGKGDYYADGTFLLYDGSPSSTDWSKRAGYKLGHASYFVRNDYTVTLSKYLYLGTTFGAAQDERAAGEKPLSTAAIRVINGGSLTIGESAAAGSGRGSGFLTFDGNTSAVLEGSMFQAGAAIVEGEPLPGTGSITINVGVTIKNHTNRSKTHPGVVEVLETGTFIMDGGVIENCVSPFAGAIYNRGTVDITDGTIRNNVGAMPRYGFATNAADGTGKLATYDTAYWGQPKYYLGAGAVYSTGTFLMDGGTVSGNRGEYGALVCAGSGVMSLVAGTASSNVAWSGNGAGSEYDLTIPGYTEGTNPGYFSVSENAGCGGAVYAVGGTLTVGANFSVSGNKAEKNGGGLAAALGTRPRRPLEGYDLVTDTGGHIIGYMNVVNAAGNQIVVPAAEPRYDMTASMATPSAASVTVQSGATITNNTAVTGNGGGVWVQDSQGRDGRPVSQFRTINLMEDVVLRNNKAGNGGGGAAAEKGGKLNYWCAITGNSARVGGGVYVTNIGMITSNGTAADLTGNWATDAGGGAYIDIGDPVDPNEADPHSPYENNSGIFSLRGGQVSANRVSNPNGQGIGVYCDGLLTLSQTAYINHGDTVHLAEHAVLNLSPEWRAWARAWDPDFDIGDAPVLNTAGDPLTITSAQEDIHTLIARVIISQDPRTYPTPKQVSNLLATGCVTHLNRPLAVKPGTDTGEIEINYVSVTYYDRATADPAAGLDSHQVLRTFIPNTSVVLGGFTVDKSFVAPQGMTFHHWAKFRFDENGQVVYLNEDDTSVDIDHAQTFQAGQEIPELDFSFCLEAVYTLVSYNVLVNVDGFGSGALAGANGQLEFEGVSTDIHHSMTVTNRTEIAITPTVPKDAPEALLQSLAIYQELSFADWQTATGGADQDGFIITDYAGQIYTYDYLVNTEHRAEEYIRAYHRFWELTSRAVLESQSGVDGLVGSPSGVIQGVTNKNTGVTQGVAAVVEAPNGLTFVTEPRSLFVHAEFKKANVRLRMAKSATTYYYDSLDLALRGAAVLMKEGDSATITLLSDLGQAAVPFYAAGHAPGTPQTATLPCPTVLDLGGFTLDLGAVIALDTGGCDLTVRNGKLTGAKLAGASALLSASSGAVRLENVQAAAARDFTVRITGSAVLRTALDCALGKVFCATPASVDDFAPQVVVLNTADLTVGTVATLCLDRWSYPTGSRQLVDFSALNTTNQTSVRPVFPLGGADLSDSVDDADRWFLGTDGVLYRRVAAVEPNELLTDDGVSLLREPDWAYLSQAPDSITIGGTKYLFYRWYLRTYGYDTAGSTLTMTARLLDAYGDPLPMSDKNAGSMSFYLSMVTNASEERHVTTTDIKVKPDGSASIVGGVNFRLPSLAATEVPVSGTLLSKASRAQHYTQTTVWSGAWQYAPEYAEFWSYGDPTRETVSGSLALSVLPKPLSDSSIQITGLPLSTVEYIGPMGAAAGYTSSPGSTITYDRATGDQLYRGVEDDRCFLLLTTDPAQAVDPLEKLTGVGDTVYYYKKGANDGKIYYTDAGAGKMDGTSLADAKPLNGADVGVYSVELYALPKTNFTGESGWKATVFTIEPYSGMLWVTGVNHVLVNAVGEHSADYYAQRILDRVLTETAPGSDKYQFAIAVHDIYGNAISADNVDFLFRPVSSGAHVDADGWPDSEGLYDLELRPRTGSDYPAGWPSKYDGGLTPAVDPNYSPLAAGYLTVLISNAPLNMVIAPGKVEVPYTGKIYNGPDVKRFDAADPNAVKAKYRAFIIATDENETPSYAKDLSDFTEAEQAIITASGLAKGDKTCVTRLLTPSDYTIEIGSSRNLPRNTGEYTMAFRDVADQYVGSATLVITRTELDRLEILDPADGKLVYSGRVQNPTLQAYDDQDNALTYNLDYALTLARKTGEDTYASGAELLNVGTYRYTARGINNFDGSAEASLTVVAKQLDNSDVEGLADPAYSGPLAQNVVRLEMPNTLLQGGTFDAALYYNGIQLDADDYTVSIADAADEYKKPVDPTALAGGHTYLVTFTGTGNFQGTLTRAVEVLSNGGVRLVNNRAYTYSGCNFAGYNWAADTTATYLLGSETKTLDLSRCDVRVYSSDDKSFTHSLYDPAITDETLQILDSGTYLVRVAPNAAYAAELQGQGVTIDGFYGVAVLQIARRTVKIMVDYMQKDYGALDPVFLYRTNLMEVAPDGAVDSRPAGDTQQLGTELYKVDKNKVTGALSRAAGEDAGTFYQYSLGTFAVQGDNYIFELDDQSRFTINRRSIAVPATGSDPFEVSWTAQLPYTGYALNPVNSVVYKAAIGDITLAEGRDYTVSYEVWQGKTYTDSTGSEAVYTPDDGEGAAYGSWTALPSTPADVGYYRVTLNGSGGTVPPHNYRDTRTLRFQINESRTVMDLAIVGSDAVTYKAAPYTPAVEVTNEGFAVGNANYSLTYSFTPYGGGAATLAQAFLPGATAFTDAGTYTIYLAGKGNFNGSTGHTTFTILPKSLAADDAKDGTLPLTITRAAGTYTYDGQPHMPTVTAQYAGLSGSGSAVTLVYGTDYTLNYSNHVNAGTGTVTAVGKGNYAGSRSLTFPIEKMPVYVKVLGATKEYGQSDPIMAYAFYDNAACAGDALSLTATGHAAWDPTEGGKNGAVGNYALSIGTLNAGRNYDLRLAGTQSFAITPKQLTAANVYSLSEYMSASVHAYIAIQEGDTVGSVLPAKPLCYWAPDALVGKYELSEGTDYTLSIRKVDGDLQSPANKTDPLAESSYELTYTGAGNFTGSFVTTIRAIRADKILDLSYDKTARTYRLEGHEVSITATMACDFRIEANTYNGRKVTPEGVLSNGGATVTYTLTDAGVYTVTAVKTEGGSSYFGSASITIEPKSIAGTAVNGTDPVSVAAAYDKEYPYTGQAVTFESVYGSAQPLLIYGDDVAGGSHRVYPSFTDDGQEVYNYIVTYENNVAPSTAGDPAKAHIFGVGNYTGTADLTFTIGEIGYPVTYVLGAKKGNTDTAYPTDDPAYPADATLYPVGATVPAPTIPADAVYPYGDGLTAVFVGWSQDQTNLVGAFSEGLPGELVPAGGGVLMGDGPLTLYAVWATDDNRNGIADYREGRYRIIYHAGVSGATGAVPSDMTTYIPASAVQVLGNTRALDYPNYSLYGWCPDAPGADGHVLDDPDAFTAFLAAPHIIYIPGSVMYIGAADRDLYAVWVLDRNGNGSPDWLESDLVQVVFYPNGGVGAIPTPITSNRGTDITLPAAPATLAREGAVFLGWSRDQTAGLVNSIEEHTDYATGAVTSTDYKIDGVAVAMLAPGDSYTVPADWVVADALPFHAVWAVDANKNGVPDYQDPWYTVSYADSTGVVATLPGAQEILTGLPVTLPGILTGTHGSLSVSLYYWTTDTLDVRDRVLDSYESAIPDGTALYQPGQSVTVTGPMTFYPIWATDDYRGGYCTVNVQVVSATGGTVSIPDTSPLTASKDQFTVHLPLGSDLKLAFVADPGYSFDAVFRSGDRVAENDDDTNGKDLLVHESDGSWTCTVKALDGNTSILVSFAANPLNVLAVAPVTYTGETFAGYRAREEGNYLSVTVQGKNSVDVTEAAGASAATGDYIVKLQQAGLDVAASKTLDVGHYFIYVQGVNAYRESFVTTPLQILPKSIAAGDTAGAGETALTVSASSIDYTGVAVRPAVTLKYNGATLTEDKDYTVSFQDSKKAPVTAMVETGTYTVILTGIGNFTGARSFPFEITKGSLYTVTYDANDGVAVDGTGTTLAVTGAVPTDSGEYLASAKVPVLGHNTLAADKALFLGWTAAAKGLVKTQADQTAAGAIYGEGHLIDDIAALADSATRVLTLYALWAVDDNENGTPDYQETFSVTATSTVGGSVSLESADAVPYGGSRTFTVTTNSGYLLTEVRVNGAKVTLDANKSYTISNIKADQVVTATFRKKVGSAQTYSVEYAKKSLAEYGLAFTYLNQDGATVTVPVADVVIKQNDETVDAAAKLPAGEYQLTLSPDPLVVTTLTVTPRALTDAMVVGSSIPAALSYTGAALDTVAPVLNDLGADLTEYAPGVANADYSFLFYRDGSTALPKDVGVYTLIFTGMNNYAGSVTRTLKVTGSTLTVVPDALSKVYGEAEPALTYTLKDAKGNAVTAALSGALTRAPGEGAGEYLISLGSLADPAGNYALALDAAPVNFTVRPKSIAQALTTDASMTLVNRLTAEDGYGDVLVMPYTGSAVDPGLVMTYASTLMKTVGLTEGAAQDYTLTYSPWLPVGTASLLDTTVPIEAGYYEVTVHGVHNYTDTFSFILHISADPSLLNVTLSLSVGAYVGDDWIDDLAMTIQRRTAAGLTTELTPGTDCAVSYLDAQGDPVTEIKNVGVYEVRVTSSDASHTGSGSAYFYVEPRDLADGAISAVPASIVDQTYTGSPITLSSSTTGLLYGSDRLVEGRDYTLEYRDNVDAGSARMVYTGMGNFSGVRVVEFNIVSEPLTVGDVTVSTPADVTYDGKSHAQPVTVTLGSDTLTENVDYTLTYSGDLTNAGPVTVTVDFIGNFAGTLPAAATYRILPKSLSDAEITATVPHLTHTGSPLAPAPSVVYQPSSLLTLMLREGTDYTASYLHDDGSTDVQTRGAYTATLTAVPGGNYTGSRPVRFNVVTGDPTLTVSVDPTSVVYTGAPVTSPTVVVTDSANHPLAVTTDYLLGYLNNTNVGVATVNVLGQNTFKLYSGSATFTITPKDVGDTVNVILSDIPALPYTGAPLTPAITLTYNGHVLQEARDFTLTYQTAAGAAVAAPVAVGSYQALVSGVGNYSGSRTVTFDVADTRLIVTYDANGGTGTTPVDQGNPYFAGDSAVALFASLTRPGAVFLGWSPTKHTAPLATAADHAAATIYAPGETFIVADTMTLHAVWGVDADGNGKADYSETYLVTASASTGGSITPSGSTSVLYGGSIAFTITVDAGFRFDSLTLDGKNVAIPARNDDGTFTYTLSSIVRSHVVVAVFTISTSGGGGGTTVIVQKPAGGDSGEPAKPAYTPPAADLPWAPEMPKLIYEEHFAYMTGRPDGTFGPTDSITRGEVAVIFTRLILGSMDTPAVTGASPFSDVKPDQWFAPYVNFLAQYGILKGYPDGTFRPEATIARGELCAVALRFFQSDLYRGEVVFDDVVPGYWGYQHIYDAYHFGFITGYTDGTFRPDAPINRAETVTIINRVLSRKADAAYERAHRSELSSFSDLQPTYWAYLDIMEATNTHTHAWTADGAELWSAP